MSRRRRLGDLRRGPPLGGQTNGPAANGDALGPTAYFDDATNTAEQIAGCHRSKAAEARWPERRR